MSENATKVLLGMTGGVDSSLSAWMLKRDGYQVVGVTLLFHDTPSIQEKIEHAKEVAAKLDFEHHVVDMTERFSTEVKARVAAEFGEGRFPNPCSLCTPSLKIPALFECAEEYGCEKVATGHYARITTDEEYGVYMLEYQLRAPLDRFKDQSYLLYRLNQDQLSRMLFPLADTHKGVVRRMAMQYGIMQFAPVEDGQGTPCFYEDKPVVDWLESEGGLEPKLGDVVNISNQEVIGQHMGIHRNAPGTEISGKYVIAGDAKTNTVYVGARQLASIEMCMLENVHWTSVETPKRKRSCKARFALGEKPVPVKITLLGDKLAVLINETVSGLSHGQDVVLYSDDLVLGGGTIA